jgi:HKD family nuclease
VNATIVGHSTDHRILDALRLTLEGAEEAILCSAFIRRAGVHLVEPQLSSLGDQARLVATSTFGGASTGEAFAALADLRTRLRVTNPSRGTFHPKLYVARSRRFARALVGSANLTGGLVANVEAAVLLEGSPRDAPLRDAWRTAEAYWAHEASETWAAVAAEQSEEVLGRELLAAIRDEVRKDPVFRTIASGRPNRVTDVTASGLWVETEASATKGMPAQHIPAWMFQLAVDHLEAHGTLTNAYLLSTDGLNVKRSSAVCAVLARLPWIEVASRRPVELARRGGSKRGSTRSNWPSVGGRSRAGQPQP